MPNPVKLSYKENEYSDTKLRPTLLLHGLDSSSQTWRNTLASLESRAVALDLRSCGHSPLGKIQEFSPDAIVADIHEFLCNHPYFTCNNESTDEKVIEPFVIIGHSMGGRVAMSFAEAYPHLIKALVIEDMDIRTRPMTMNAFQSGNRDQTIQFDKDLGKLEVDDIVTLFEKEGYPSNSVEKWLKEGRIEKKDDGSFYSQVNPAFRLLCYEQFFITNHGEDCWKNLAKQTEYKFPIHVMVADSTMTVCDEESIWEMKKTMKEYERFMSMHRYKGATHSIHNSKSKEFLADINAIIRAASLGS